MVENIKDGSIVILKDKAKKNFIKKFREANDMKDVKILGLNEFKKKYLFDYTNEAIYYIHKKYGIIKDIAEIYLENLYFIEDIEDPKVEFLKSIKNDLQDKNLLIENHEFKKYILTKPIVLYDLNYLDKFYEKLFKTIDLSTNVIKIDFLPGNKTKKNIYKFANKEKEIFFLATRIAEMLKSGVDINRIKIANLNKDYYFLLVNIFKDFGIPIELEKKESISSTLLVSKFKEFFSSNIKETLDNIKRLVFSSKDEKIYKIIIDVLNNYNWIENMEEVKDFIFQDLDNQTIPIIHLRNCVRTIDFENDIIDDDDYIFLINFNQGVFPINYKNEDFLNDFIKNKLSISDSLDLNRKMNQNIQERISKIKNLTVSYIERDLTGELYISSAYKEELFIEKEFKEKYTYSNKYNKKSLIKEKDENRKYGTVTKKLIELSNHYNDEPYLTYDNKFKGVSKELLQKYLEDKLVLSYSSMNSYYLCSYRYFLSNILKLDKFEDTFEISIGNIFHNVLREAFENDFDFEQSWNNSIQKEQYEFKVKDLFFLNILKEELKFVINYIIKQKEYTELDKALYEQKISVELPNNNNVIFKGFVDKILYTEKDGNKIAAIVDYKTGNPELSLDNAIYGIDMQLPIYVYLLKNFEEFKDAKIGGFYLQKILNNIKDLERKNTSLKLQGYSNRDTKILSIVDKSYADSKIIKSLKQSSNGFYAYSKIITDKEIEKLVKIVKDKIENAALSIMEANFEINPKQIGDKLVGCRFCKFKDICYMKNSDIQKLEKRNKKDFLGGEEIA